MIVALSMSNLMNMVFFNKFKIEDMKNLLIVPSCMRTAVFDNNPSYLIGVQRTPIVKTFCNELLKAEVEGRVFWRTAKPDRQDSLQFIVHKLNLNLDPNTRVYTGREIEQILKNFNIEVLF